MPKIALVEKKHYLPNLSKHLKKTQSIPKNPFPFYYFHFSLQRRKEKLKEEKKLYDLSRSVVCRIAGLGRLLGRDNEDLRVERCLTGDLLLGPLLGPLETLDVWNTEGNGELK